MAILHVGPHKMGSTSIQVALAEFQDDLSHDGFLVPSLFDGAQRLYAAASYLRCPEGVVEPCAFVTCPLRCNDREVEQGWRDLLTALDTARSQGRSVILSAEDFDRPDVRVKELFDALHGFDVRTVVMYRHYFDWIASVYGHLRAHELYALQCTETGLCNGATAWEERRTNTLADAALRYTPLVNWLNNETMTSYLEIFTPAVLQRFAKFGSVDAIMIDAQGIGTPEGTLEEAFFCRGWTPRACSTARANAAEKAGDLFWRRKRDALERQNEKSLAQVLALELAVVASNEGLLPANANALNAATFLADFLSKDTRVQEVPMRCIAAHPGYTGPMRGVAAQLWDITSTSANSVLSLTVHLTGRPLVGLNKTQLQKAFSDAKTSTLCSVDGSKLHGSSDIRKAIDTMFDGRSAQYPAEITQAPPPPMPSPSPLPPPPPPPIAWNSGKGERMVRVVSVHVGDTDWVPTQASMLVRHVSLPFRLYTIVSDGRAEYVSGTWQRITGNKPAMAVAYSDAMKAADSWDGPARCVLTAAPSCDHAVLLEFLMSHAVQDARGGTHDDDILLVLDSDAWPVASLSQHVLPLIDGGSDAELVAVRRSVEGMALWPHPSFAVTTCGVWRRSWHSWGLAPVQYTRDRTAEDSRVRIEGFTRDLHNQIGSASKEALMCHDHPDDLDTGSVLWGSYNDSMSKWKALPRMNTMNLDPLYYGVYGVHGVAIVYHEGAGTTQRGGSKITNAFGMDSSFDDASRHLRDAVSAARDEVHALVRDLQQLPQFPAGYQLASGMTEQLDLQGSAMHRLDAQLSGMDQLVELLLHPDKSPLERSDVMEACEMMREQILLAAAKKSQPPECKKQVENLCRAQVEIKPVQHARA